MKTGSHKWQQHRYCTSRNCSSAVMCWLRVVRALTLQQRCCYSTVLVLYCTTEYHTATEQDIVIKNIFSSTTYTRITVFISYSNSVHSNDPRRSCDFFLSNNSFFLSFFCTNSAILLRLIVPRRSCDFFLSFSVRFAIVTWCTLPPTVFSFCLFRVLSRGT